MKEQIEYKGKLYKIESTQYEPYDIFIKRCWFIVKNQPSNQEEFNKIYYYSNLWSNIYFKKCKYNETITNIINNLVPC
jgi:hypothetical protein